MIRAFGNRTVAIWTVVAAALFLRLFRLSTPGKLIFDEIYYVDGARDYLDFGVEVSADKPEFIVHPPIGKWVIALGIRTFGDNPFGWRVGVALLGTLSILMIAKIASRLLGALGYGLIAALLALFDGLNLVMSRSALLDMTLTTFLLIATWFLIERRFLLAGLFFGLSLGTKWNAIFYILAFTLFFLLREIRENAKNRKLLESAEASQTNLREVIGLVLLRKLQLLVVPIVVYVASWFGWFSSMRGWSRSWAEENGILIFPTLRSFIHYQFEILNFHQGLNSRHNYRSDAWQWIFQWRPTSFFYESPKCSVGNCSQEVLAMGTPLLWWSGVLALVVLIVLWFRYRRHSLILLGVAAGWLPWFAFPDRTTFSFYSIIFEPWVILAIVAAIKEINERAPARFSRRARKGALALYISIIGGNFLYHAPIFLAITLSYEHWRSLMWFNSWI